MKAEHKSFYNDVLKELETGSLAIFAGAGLSVGAGHVNWKQLLKEITEDLGLDYNSETDLIAIAQYNTNKIGNRSVINRKIIDEFNKDIEETENHKILARLPIYSYWTTNYDNLIERSLEKAFRVPDVKHSIKQLPYPKPKRDAVVYKMHGDATMPQEAVITKDDYERYATDKAPFLTTLNSELISKLFVFIGFSFTDPNLDYVLSRVRIHLREAQRHHWHFVRKVSKDDYEADKMAQFEYDQKKQMLFVEDLKRFGLQPVFVETHQEITDILKEIEEAFKRKTVFISGSAEDYTHWNSLDGQGFIHQLSAKLVEKGMKIVNGFGWGVGSAVINGALSKIYEHPNKYSKDQLIIKPFPQFPTGEKTLQVLWEEYRQDMIGYAGIFLVIFGNKKDPNEPAKLVDANGVYREFEIAKSKGLLVIPIGSTGWVAEKIHSELKAQNFGLEKGSKLIPLFEELGF
ncbi:SIR2 family protein [Pedobacter sp. UC225_65]|uniref:SIR2 family protein n=1 Tax=Pedobacter sp. UC225_65 TaxID=3350173 RepID=UPI0036731C2F